MDYKNGKIYTIRSYQTELIYIGSTCSPLSKRLSQHRKNYKKFLNGKYNNITSFEILKYGDAYIELLEEYPCENKMMLEKREGELIRNNECVNKYIAGRTGDEWYADNKEKVKERNNKDVNKKHKQDYNKQYREKHRQKLIEYSKNYYHNQKEKVMNLTGV